MRLSSGRWDFREEAKERQESQSSGRGEVTYEDAVKGRWSDHGLQPHWPQLRKQGVRVHNPVNEVMQRETERIRKVDER